MSLSLIITNAGRAALVNAQNNGTAPVVIAACGVSATALTPLATATSLPGEIKRIATLSGSVPSPDTIHVVVRDESADAFTVRSLGLYLADGTLFALYGQTATILEKAAQAIMLLAVDVKFADIAATSISFGDANFLNPPATETVKGVAEIATQAETDGGTDDIRIVTPKKLAARLTSWLASWGADIWRSNNDGSGSGLDADLLDGQQGSWYANIIARLGFTPANINGDTFTGNIFLTPGPGKRVQVNSSAAAGGAVISGGDDSHSGYVELYRPNGSRAGYLGCAEEANGMIQIVNDRAAGFSFWGGNLFCDGSVLWHAGNDGAGSGADADLLDGQQGSWYSDILARLGWTPVRQGSGAGQLNNVVKIGWSPASRLKATVDSTDLGYFVFDGHIADVWRASNDGAGSGLDADVLDGWHRDDIRHWNNLLANPFNWSGQPGQPQWLWGGNEAGTYRVWNPSNFSVAYAAGAGNADTVDGYHGSAFFGWHNDGSGSGLDADVWRGLTPQQLIDSYFTSGSNENGWYEKRVGGMIHQGNFIIARLTESEGIYSVTFPIPFPTAPRTIQLTGINSDGSTFKDEWPQVVDWTNTGFRYRMQFAGGGTSHLLDGMSWHAFGN